MTVVRKLRTIRSLGPARRGVLAEALVLPLSIGISFWVVGVPRTQALLRRLARSGRPPSVDSAYIEESIRLGNWAQRLVRRRTGIGGSCLVRSLTLWSILLRRGVETDLRVGFRRAEGNIEGHAWLEREGRILNEREDVARTYVTAEGPMRFDVRWR